MTAVARLEAAGSGRSAPFAGRLKPHRNAGGESAQPAADLPPDVCNFRLSEVRNFRLSLTTGRTGLRDIPQDCLPAEPAIALRYYVIDFGASSARGARTLDLCLRTHCSVHLSYRVACSILA